MWSFTFDTLTDDEREAFVEVFRRGQFTTPTNVLLCALGRLAGDLDVPWPRNRRSTPRPAPVSKSTPH